MQRFLDYNSKLKERAKSMRKNMTKYEKKLWFEFLQEFQKNYNLRVLRQRPIDNYIVDFYIPKLKLVIEVDWDNHFSENWIIYDLERTNILNWLWLKVLRFTNLEILENFSSVSEKILEEIN